jgi:alcohol dehydrogenase class IV
MVKPFHFARLPLIYFGAGKISGLPDIISRYGTTVLIVTGKRSFLETPQAALLIKHLKEKGIIQHHLAVASEPSPALIDDTVSRYRDAAIDVVAAFGGGSVIDAGKAISAMLCTAGSVKDYLEVVGAMEHPGTKIPFIAVPTTSGTGSEATKNAVISEVGINGFKRSLRHDNFVPDIAIVDPELTLNCPPDITAAAGMDCFTQLTEAYLSVKPNEYTDALAKEGIRAVHRSLLRSFTDGDDIEARSDMSFAALTSGICLANAGLGAVHGIAGTTGGMFNIPHGVVCGTLMAATNEINIREIRRAKEVNRAMKKYAVLGKITSGIEGRDDDFYADRFVEYLHDLTEKLGLQRLSKFGITAADIPLISSQADVKNNPVRLTVENIAEIIERRL